MSQICHHTAENWGNKSTLKGPVLGTGQDNYFGPGFYFWDNNLKHAKWWGNKQYRGNYYVFEASLVIDKNQMFDTTDRNDIEFLKKSLSVFLDNNIDLSDFFLGTVISLFKEEEAKTGKIYFPYRYAKGVDEGRNNAKNPYNSLMKFSNRAQSGFYLNPVVFFCIFKEEDVNLHSFLIVSEEGVSVK